MWVSRAEMRRLLDDRRSLRAKVDSLEADLRLERERNRAHEERLIDQVLTAAGRYAVSDEPKAATRQRAPQPAPLTALEEARRDALRKAAVEAGLSVEDGERVWQEERHGRIVSYAPEEYFA